MNVKTPFRFYDDLFHPWKMQNMGGLPVARQSALEKARAEAKAKKLRDEKEAASALEDFVKEFDADLSEDENTQLWQTGGTEGGMLHTSNQGAGAGVAYRGSRRHFTNVPRQVVSSSHSPLPLDMGVDCFFG